MALLSPSSLPASIVRRFQERTGESPSVVAAAPGRINVIGEHVDYQEGLVLPAAIDRHVVIAARAMEVPELRLRSSNKREPVVIPLDRDTPLEGHDVWANYVLGVVAVYRAAGHSVSGLEAVIESPLPEGAGLSSSAALESATALVVEALGDFELSVAERALLCQKAEHRWAGVPCGIMDQLASNGGLKDHALRIDCRSLDMTATKLPSSHVFVVVNSGVRHELADGEYAKRRADCETASACLGVKTLRDADFAKVQAAEAALGERVFRRARHVVREIDRVDRFIEAMEEGEVAQAGALMDASHASLRDDFEVSAVELDQLVDLARELGAAGARLMGGGFGGSTINMLPVEAAGHFAEQVVELARERHGLEVESFLVRPVDGGSADFAD